MLKKGVAQNDRIPPEKKMEYGLISWNNIKTNNYRWEIAFNTKCQRDPFFVHLGSDYTYMTVFNIIFRFLSQHVLKSKSQHYSHSQVNFSVHGAVFKPYDETL